jgi:hypothetical protein
MDHVEEMMMLRTVNGTGFNNGRVCFIIINTMLLRITTTDPTSFVIRKTSIGVNFLMKTHLPDKMLMLEGRGTSLPGVVLKESIELTVHGSGPIGIEKSGFVRLWK